MSGEPITIKEFKKKWLFGLIFINYYVEDRRPDVLNLDEINFDKYKHYIYFRVFFNIYNWTFRTKFLYEDLPYINGKPQ